MLGIVMRIGVCRSRIKGCFIVAGRKLCGLSFEASCHFLDKRGTMDASLSFSFMARPNVTMSASKPPQKMHIRAFGMEPFKGAMVAESPVTTSAPDGCAKKAQKERPQKTR